MTIYNPGPEDLFPMLRAENAEVLIHPSDRKYGALLVGGQGCGKSSALLSYLKAHLRVGQVRKAPPRSTAR